MDTGRDQARRLARPAAVYTLVLRQAVETAQPIAAAPRAAATPTSGCAPGTRRRTRNGLPVTRFQADHAVAGGGVFRPFEDGNETWAELVVRAGRSVLDIADRHRGGTAVLVGHGETVESSFHVLADQPLYHRFDLKVAPASVTEWATGDDPFASATPGTG
jgi:broad specificity phosphatase PhoE